MATIQNITLHANKGGSTFSSVNHHYIGRTSSAYRIYYKIPITLSNEIVKSFTLTSGLWVSNGGSAQTNTINARLYTTEADAKSYSNNYIAEATTGNITIFATTGPITFTFSNLNLTTVSNLYVSMVTVNAVSGNLLEIVNYYYPGSSTSNSLTSVHASATTTPNSYTVTYHKNGADTGSAPASQSKIHGQTLQLQGKGTLNHVGTETSDTYKITFDSTGGSSVSTLTATKTKSWTLDGWNTKADGTGTSYAFSGNYTANASVDLYVKWGVKYTTTSVTLSNTPPSKTGNDFQGWNTKENGTGTSYRLGQSFTPESGFTLYAIWGLQQRTLTYDHNDGSGITQTQSLNYNTSTTLSFTKPTRRGYIFLGWADTDSATTAKYTTGSTISITANKIIYAVWSPLTFTITYNLNGGSIKQNAQYTTSINYDATCTILSSTDISKTKNDFQYWTTKADGSPDGYNWTNWSGPWAYIDGQYGIINKKLTLYAVWKPSPFKITYSIYNETYTPETAISNKESILDVKSVLNESRINNKSLLSYDKFDCWSINGQSFTTIDTLWNAIDLNATSNESPRRCTLTAVLSPRYKLVYYKGTRFNKLTPVTYDALDRKFHTLKISINK